MIQKLPPPERAEVEAKIEAVDPLRFAPALRDRALAGKVLMINAAEDEVIPRHAPRSWPPRWAFPIASFGWKGSGTTRRWPSCPGRCG